MSPSVIVHTAAVCNGNKPCPPLPGILQLMDFLTGCEINLLQNIFRICRRQAEFYETLQDISVFAQKLFECIRMITSVSVMYLKPVSYIQTKQGGEKVHLR